MPIKTLNAFVVPELRDSVFTWPAYGDWETGLRANKRLIGELPGRDEARRELWKIIRGSDIVQNEGLPINAPETFVVTGHQPVWHHGGIWVKDAIGCAAAKTAGGRCVHLVLDHDVKDTALVIPGRNGNGDWVQDRVILEPNDHQMPMECRPVLRKSQVEEFIDAIEEKGKSILSGSLWERAGSIRGLANRDFKNGSEFVTAVQAGMNEYFRFDAVYLRVSDLAASRSFYRFVASIASKAGEFSAVYNRGVERARSRIRYLFRDEHARRYQLPFWVLSTDGRRMDLFVTVTKKDQITFQTKAGENGVWEMGSSEDDPESLKKVFVRQGYRIRPKAVTLTLFVRLYLADWFIHGTGGALYETVGDHVLEEFWGITGLRFGVATATTVLPLTEETAETGESQVSKQWIHHMPNNPERYMKSDSLESEPWKSLVAAKKLAICDASDPRRSSRQRKVSWEYIKEINRTLFARIQDRYDAQVKECGRFSQVKAKNRCTCREYFYGFFSPEHLFRLISQ